MAITTSAVHDDRLVGPGPQKWRQTPVVSREIIPREIMRTRHMPLLEEDARACVEDGGGVPRFNGRTKFRKPEGCGRRDLERRSANKGSKLPSNRCSGV
jgi:hypothetical protein